MLKINYYLSLILLIAMLSFYGCDSPTSSDADDTVLIEPDTDYDARVLTELDNKGDANESSPLAPEIVAGQNMSGRAIISADDQNFGSFGMIQNSAGNYNSMTESTVPSVLSAISLDPNDSLDVSLGPFVRMWDNGADGVYYESEDGGVASVLSANPTETRQYDAFAVSDAAEYEYSRCYFWWGETSDGAGVDVTEVWEYSDYKLVSVTMYSKDFNFGTKYLAVTDTSDDMQKTSMLVGSFNYEDDKNKFFSFDTYYEIGYIDFSMTTAESASFDGTGDFLPTDFPSFEDLQDVHMRSIRMADAKNVTFDSEDLHPYIGFLQ